MVQSPATYAEVKHKPDFTCCAQSNEQVLATDAEKLQCVQTVSHLDLLGGQQLGNAAKKDTLGVGSYQKSIVGLATKENMADSLVENLTWENMADFQVRSADGSAEGVTLSPLPVSQSWENMADSQNEIPDFSDSGNTVNPPAEHPGLENMADSLGNRSMGGDLPENMADCGKGDTMLEEMASKELPVERGCVVLLADRENMADSTNCQGESIGVGFSFAASHESPAARNVVTESLGSTSSANMADVEVMQDRETTPNVALAVDSNESELTHTRTEPVFGLAQGAGCHPTTKIVPHENDEIVVVDRVHAVSISAPLSVAQLGAHAVIDTGAEVTVMSENYFNKLSSKNRPKLRPADRGLVVAEAGRKMTHAGIADVDFEMNGHHYKWPMYIAPIHDDVLLGADFLDCYKATVNFSKGLCLGGEWIPCQIRRRGNNVHRILLDEVVTIPRGHEIILPGVILSPWTDGPHALVEPTWPEKEGILIGRSLDRTEDSVVPVRCANLRDDPVSLPLGYPLAELVAVDDVLPVDAATVQRVCHHHVYIDSGEIPYPEWDMPRLQLDDEDDGAILADGLQDFILNGFNEADEYASSSDELGLGEGHGSSLTSVDQMEQARILSLVEIEQGTPDDTTLLNEADVLPEHIKDLYVRSAASIPQQQDWKMLLDLLLEQQMVFAKDKTELGHCDLVQHKINTGNAAPVRQPFRPTPKGFEGEELKHLKEQLDAGVVVPSSSPWASAVVLVRKKDQSVRWCVDEESGMSSTTGSLQQDAVGLQGPRGMENSTYSAGEVLKAPMSDQL